METAGPGPPLFWLVFSWLRSLESAVSQTKYNPFKGMVLRYKILLLQDGTKLHGTAEKVYEKSDKERVFTGVKRTTATLDGTIQKAYVGRSTIVLHVVEAGEERSFSWIMGARCRRFGRRMHLTGEFSSTAGDASGTVVFWLAQHRVNLPLTSFERYGISRTTLLSGLKCSYSSEHFHFS
jgi:hypothetical protein